MRPNPSLDPQMSIIQKPQKLPISLSQTVPQSLWKVHLWVSQSPSSHRSSLLQDLGYVVLSLHVTVQEKHKFQESRESPGVQRVSILQGRVLDGLESARAGTIGAAMCPLPYCTRTHGRILTTNYTSPCLLLPSHGCHIIDLLPPGSLLTMPFPHCMVALSLPATWLSPSWLPALSFKP